MLSSPIVPADSVHPASYFLDLLDAPVVLTAIRLVLVMLALGVCGMYLYARRKSRVEARSSEESSRS